MDKSREFAEKIFEKIRKSEVKDKKSLEKVKKAVGKSLGLKTIPTNPDILQFADEREIEKFSKIVNIKPTRTISGVSVITVVAKPAHCPGKCIYCPKGDKAPQSYTGLEPAIQRGIRNGYDPFLQTKDRLNQYRITGHHSDKVEIIILGGTFLALDPEYQEWFVKRIFDALNGEESESLTDAQRLNETGNHRCVGLTIETRPDYCFESHVNQVLLLGGTRVEIGVQTIYQEILEKIKRGHSVKDTVKATKVAKESALKCTYHIMPGLFVDKKDDIKQFKILFEDSDYRPDSLKIYPTLVIENTELHDMWKRGDYNPLETEEAVDLIVKAMKYIPKYCRVIRVQRDIPNNKVVKGVMSSNLRELVEAECRRRKVRIQEMRYREVGHRIKNGIVPNPNKIELCRLNYNASGGEEVFLSFEDSENDVLFGFLRLRIPEKPFRKEIDIKTALVRELHVFGPTVPIGRSGEGGWQHRGLGQRLLKEAERIAAEEFDKRKVAVISGIGVREYYKRLGYKRDGPYMSKIL